MTKNVWVLQLKKKFLPYETSGAPRGPPWLVGPENNSRLSPPVYGPGLAYSLVESKVEIGEILAMAAIVYIIL